MSRMTIDKARRSTDMFSLRRFGGAGTTKESRHQAWLSFRTEGVGGSDMSTILGFNTYKTPYELWLEKTGRQEPEDISGRWAIIKGNALEVELRRRFRQLHPEFQVIDGTDISLVSDAHPVMHASLDGFIYDEASDSWGILEIKTANANRGRTDWHNDEGELIAPDYYMAQVTHYMAVTGFTWGVFYADIGESEPVEVRFERDEDDIHAVIKAAEDFWGFVTRDEMPTLTGADVAKAYPEPSEGIEDMSDSTDLRRLMADYQQTTADLSALKQRKEELQDCILPYIGDHEGVRCGNMQATYKHSTRKGYTRVVQPWEGRTFRFTEIKPKKTK
jgi:putative phage-type endonuclease